MYDDHGFLEACPSGNSVVHMHEKSDDRKDLEGTESCGSCMHQETCDETDNHVCDYYDRRGL